MSSSSAPVRSRRRAGTVGAAVTVGWCVPGRGDGAAVGASEYCEGTLQSSMVWLWSVTTLRIDGLFACHHLPFQLWLTKSSTSAEASADTSSIYEGLICRCLSRLGGGRGGKSRRRNERYGPTGWIHGLGEVAEMDRHGKSDSGSNAVDGVADAGVPPVYREERRPRGQTTTMDD